MKKLILLFTLLSGVALAQIPFPAYMPINSSRSFTAGNSTFSNVIARGTLSVGSTATITGALKASSTMSLGSANLTGGNTGTVAVLSDAVFCVNFNPATFNPSDGASIYFGNSQFAFSSAANSTITLPYNCTLIGYDFSGTVVGTQSTAESATLSIAGTTTASLNSSITFSAGSGLNPYSGTGLSNSFNANDKINAKIIFPTYATNPTIVYVGLTLWFVRRS